MHTCNWTSGTEKAWLSPETKVPNSCVWLGGDSRRTLRNESNEEIHVVDEGVVVGAGKVFGLVFVGSRGVMVDVDEAVLHTRDVSQVFWQFPCVERIHPRLWQRCED